MKNVKRLFVNGEYIFFNRLLLKDNILFVFDMFELVKVIYNVDKIEYDKTMHVVTYFNIIEVK